MNLFYNKNSFVNIFIITFICFHRVNITESGDIYADEDDSDAVRIQIIFLISILLTIVLYY